MLTDTKRNHAYAACLKEVVRPGKALVTCTASIAICQKCFVSSMIAGQDVLDIGTGTGLLAMLAAHHANKPLPGKSNDANAIHRQVSVCVCVYVYTNKLRG